MGSMRNICLLLAVTFTHRISSSSSARIDSAPLSIKGLNNLTGESINAIRDGQSLQLQCVVRDTSFTNITWDKDGVPMTHNEYMLPPWSDDPRYGIELETVPETGRRFFRLSILNITREEGGSFACKSEHHRIQDIKNITVRFDPASWYPVCTSRNGSSSVSTTLRCSTEIGFPEHHLVWYMNQKLYPPEQVKIEKNGTILTSTLKNVTLLNSEHFECRLVSKRGALVRSCHIPSHNRDADTAAWISEYPVRSRSSTSNYISSHPLMTSSSTDQQKTISSPSSDAVTMPYRHSTSRPYESSSDTSNGNIPAPSNTSPNSTTDDDLSTKSPARTPARTPASNYPSSVGSGADSKAYIMVESSESNFTSTRSTSSHKVTSAYIPATTQPYESNSNSSSGNIPTPYLTSPHTTTGNNLLTDEISGNNDLSTLGTRAFVTEYLVLSSSESNYTSTRPSMSSASAEQHKTISPSLFDTVTSGIGSSANWSYESGSHPTGGNTSPPSVTSPYTTTNGILSTENSDNKQYSVRSLANSKIPSDTSPFFTSSFPNRRANDVTKNVTITPQNVTITNSSEFDVFRELTGDVSGKAACSLKIMASTLLVCIVMGMYIN